MVVGIWGQTRCLGAGGANRGTDTIFDVRHTGRERSTCNVQLSRFNGVTERAHGGRDIGTGTMFGLSDAGGLVRPEGSGRRLGFHLGNNADIQLADVASGLLKRWN